jgi:hypothetical protein
MNRSILIVICDFLLLSLLTFSTDFHRLASDQTRRKTSVEVATNELASPAMDMVALMKQALADERKGHDQLQQQLAAVNSRNTALAKADEENTRLKQEAAELRQRNTAAQQQSAAVQTRVESLTHQLQESTTQAQASREKLAATEAEVRKRAEQAAGLKQQVDQYSHSNQLAQVAEGRLSDQLQLSEAQRQAALDRAALLQQEVQAARAENARLAEGLKSLATNSSQLTQEIRDNRALAPNTIFSDFVTNRVRVAIAAARSGFLGMGVNKDKHGEAVLVTDGTTTVAICHLDDTPLTLGNPGTDWEKLQGTLSGQISGVPLTSMSFHRADPRLVMFPVSPAEVELLGRKVYRLANDPYKFQDAVLIGADDGYYGQCDFQIDVNLPQYVKLDRSLLRGLFGKFNPSQGDVVLSRKGEVLGIMVNSTYCVMLQDFATTATLKFGLDVRTQHTGDALAQMYDRVFQMSARLQ